MLDSRSQRCKRLASQSQLETANLVSPENSYIEALTQHCDYLEI